MVRAARRLFVVGRLEAGELEPFPDPFRKLVEVEGLVEHDAGRAVHALEHAGLHLLVQRVQNFLPTAVRPPIKMLRREGSNLCGPVRIRASPR